MPFWLESDTFADDPVWDALAQGHAGRRAALKAAYCDLKAKASHLLTDGYLTEETALRYAGKRTILDRLATPVLGRRPRLHRPGDDCDCLDDTWVEGYAWRIHRFLRRNPSRAEYRRNRAQRADLRDARLKTAVYERDGGCCRYCRSGPLSAKAGRSRDRRKVLTYDHVDPDAPAGPDGNGLVVACGRCNEHKGHRTPDEADMTLLRPPEASERAEWAARGLALFDPTDHRPITDESPTNHRHDADPTSHHDADPISDTDGDPTDDTTADVYPQHSEQGPDQQRACSPKAPGVGRGGEAAVPGPDPRPPQPARHGSAPDVYTRRSRAPAGLPPFVWPAGSVPVTPPEDVP